MYDDELEEEEGGSRLFVILAIGLIGLLVLGLLGIGGVFVIRQNIDEQTAASRPTPDIQVRLPQPSPTFTPSPIATNTPAPTPTNTPVVAPGSEIGAETAGQSDRREGLSEWKAQSNTLVKSGEEPDNSTSTQNAVPSGETAEVPNTGLGALESVLIAAGLIFVFIVARRMRLAS